MLIKTYSLYKMLSLMLGQNVAKKRVYVRLGMPVGKSSGQASSAE